MAKKSKINTNNVLTGLIYVIVGVLLCILKSGMLNILFTVLGVLLLAYGIYDIVKKAYVEGIILVVFGVVILIGGWTILKIILIIVGALLIAYGIYNFIQLSRKKSKNTMGYIGALLTIVVGVLFIVAHWVLLDWFFIVLGAVAIIDGLIILFSK